MLVNIPDLEKTIRKAIKKDDASTLSKTLESLGKLLGIVFSAAAIMMTIFTYRNSEKWKKAEFSVAQFRVFQNNRSVKLVNQILDYDEKELPLFSDTQRVVINENRVVVALYTDNIKGAFDDKESKLREVFDEYLDELSLFNRYYKEGVVDSSVLKPYLSYQIKLLADIHHKRKSNMLSRLQKQLWIYIDYYEFGDVKELCKIFGYDVDPRKYPKIKSEAESELGDN